MAVKNKIRIFFAMVLVTFLILVILFNIVNLHEAFGSGPPYYSQTTNMDKWTNPIPILLIVDTIMMLVIIVYFFCWRRRRKGSGPYL